MGSQPGDLSYESFLEISEALKLEYTEDLAAWAESPFKWIKDQPPSRKGSIAERLVAEWLNRRGLSVGSSPGSDSDRLVNNVPVEIKSSTLWEQGVYWFQQIRDQDYDILICLGLSPSQVHAWVFPKSLLMRLRDEDEVGGIGPQHAGQEGTDTAMLQITPSSPPQPEWIQEWGGSLPEAYSVLQELLDE